MHLAARHSIDVPKWKTNEIGDEQGHSTEDYLEVTEGKTQENKSNDMSGDH